MMTQMLNRTLLLATAPFLGVFIWLGFFAAYQLTIDSVEPVPQAKINIEENTDQIAMHLTRAKSLSESIAMTLEQKLELYSDTAELAASMHQIAAIQAQKPITIYDQRVTNLLGKPRYHISTPNIDLKLFNISEGRYSGYAMKVHPKTDQAMKMVLGYDQVGKAETTSSAVKRYEAIAGVNAGGFADDTRSGKRYPLSTTMLNGQFIMPFEASYKDLFFVGLDKQLKLIGGKFKAKDKLEALDPLFGASFVPILLQDGEKQTIPRKWQTSPARAPRTVIGNYKHEHLLFLVIDGRDENGSSGATLHELQDLLSRLGVMDAYNLDGGGSSTLVVNNRLINSPSDGIQRKLPTHFLFFK